MADSRRTRDYQPDAPLELQYLNDPRYTPLDQIGGSGLGGAGNASGLDPSQQELLGGIDQRLANIQQLGDQRKGLEDQINALPPQLKTSYGLDLSGIKDALSGVGSAIGNGLSALVPSRDTLNEVGMRLQNAGAGYFGTTPPYLQQAKLQAEMGQHQDLMSYRRQALQQQLEQIQESKRQHNMQIMEKILASGNIDALEEFGKEFPPAATLAKATNSADMMEIPSYIQRGWLPQSDVNDFVSGKWTPNYTKVRLNQLRKRAEAVDKHEAEIADLKTAMKQPYDSLDAYQKSLVDAHLGKIELNTAKINQADTASEKNLAQADLATAKSERGPEDKLLGNDREALTQEMFGKGVRYNTLNQEKMAKVNNRLLQFQGQQQLNKSTAVQQAQLNVPDKPSASEREKSAEAMSSLDLMDRLEASYSPDYVGPARGRYGAALEKGYVPGDDITEQEATFRSLNTTLKNKVIKLITGAQMSEPEANRILGEVPDSTNPPTVFQARMKATRENIRLLEQRRRETMTGSGIEASGMPPVPGRGTPKSSNKDKIQSAIDEALGR